MADGDDDYVYDEATGEWRPASELAAASGRSIELEAASVPLLNGARALVRGNIPGGGKTNRMHFGARIEIDPAVPEDVADLLFDPQTSGGLLISVAAHAADGAQRALEAAGVHARRVGRVVESGPSLIRVG